MALSTNSYVSKVMTNFVSERMQSYGDDGFVAGKLLPFVGVTGKTGTFYTRNRWLAKDLPANHIVRGSKSPTAKLPDWSASTDTYSVHDEALESVLPFSDIDSTEPDGILTSRQDEVERVREALLQYHEVQTRSLLVSTLTGNSLRTGVASSPGANEFVQWDDTTDGTPLQDLEGWCTYLLKTSGKAPNFIVVPRQVAAKLKFLANITQPTYQAVYNVMDREKYKLFFDLQYVFVPEVVHDTDALGDTTPTFDFIWGNEIILGYLPERPSRRTRAFGYTFVQTNLEGGGISESNPFRVRSWKDEELGRGAYVDVVETVLDRKIVDSSLYLRIANPLASVS